RIRGQQCPQAALQAIDAGRSCNSFGGSPMPITGRTTSILMPLVLLVATAAPRAETGPVPGAQALAYDLYKSPTCGCCELWQDHLDASAFAATVHHPQDLDGVKRQLGIR